MAIGGTSQWQPPLSLTSQPPRPDAKCGHTYCAAAPLPVGEELLVAYPPERTLPCQHTRNQGGYWHRAAAVRAMWVGESATAAPRSWRV
eukprot:COSAG01_NODE_23670_length_806_cov_1.018388_3_plen_88_part_01